MRKRQFAGHRFLCVLCVWLQAENLLLKVAEDGAANFSHGIQVHLSGSNDCSYFRTWSSNPNIWEKMVCGLCGSQGQQGAVEWTQSHFSVIQE